MKYNLVFGIERIRVLPDSFYLCEGVICHVSFLRLALFSPFSISSTRFLGFQFGSNGRTRKITCVYVGNCRARDLTYPRLVRPETPKSAQCNTWRYTSSRLGISLLDVCCMMLLNPTAQDVSSTTDRGRTHIENQPSYLRCAHITRPKERTSESNNNGIRM